MSYPNQPPHMYPYIPPPYLHPPLGLQMGAPAPVMLTKPPITVPTPAAEHQKFSPFDKPITTVFIGNISEKISDSLMKDILAKCGNVLSWKRVQGASGKLQAFGFCEYDNPEATLRCIRLLNEFVIADKALVVKVDPKTDELLAEYKVKKQKAIEDREAEDLTRTEEEKKERINLIYAREAEDDKNALIQMKKILKESGSGIVGSENSKKSEKSDKTDKADTEKNDLNTESADLDGDKKSLISREIASFRNKHKDEDYDEERYKRIREREKEKRRDRSREGRDRHSHRHRSRSRSKKSRGPIEEDRHRNRASSRASSNLSKKNRRSGSKDTSHRSSSKRSKRDSDKELDEYEVMMFKKLEKKLRDKEAAYQKRLQAWELREQKRIKSYELERDREISKENEIAEEARKLQMFFEDYDDDKWDFKYYRATELERRLASRREEELIDEKDRFKEQEQIENTRQRLLKEQNPNVEAIILRMEQSMQEHLQKRLKVDFDNGGTQGAVVKDNVSGGNHRGLKNETMSDVGVHGENNDKGTYLHGETVVSENTCDDDNDETTRQKSNSFSIKIEATKPPCLTNHDTMNIDYSYSSECGKRTVSGDSESDTGEILSAENSMTECSSSSNILTNVKGTNDQQHGFLIDDQVSGDRSIVNDNISITIASAATATEIMGSGGIGNNNQLSNADRKSMVKKIIDGIPTVKADLFAYPIEWDMIDEVFVESRIKPWVDKKIVAYIGEEEPSLSKFICDQVLDHKSPDQILADIAMVLEEEADVFVMKMWRLLIYVIEERKAGLDK